MIDLLFYPTFRFYYIIIILIGGASGYGDSKLVTFLQSLEIKWNVQSKFANGWNFEQMNNFSFFLF